MKNDFLVFGGDGAANVIDQDTYAGLTERFTGFQAGVAQSAELNKVWRQSSIMAAVLAQFIVDLTGRDVIDDGTVPTVLSNLKTAIGAQSAGVVGNMRNARMVIASALTAASFTADEVVVQSALGGRTYVLANVSLAINLTATGVGGMDKGTAPASGYVAIYAIHNPVSGARALLAVNATAAVAPEVYGGANMPEGYAASALISVWPTTAGGQFQPGLQIGRWISRSPVTVLSTSGATGAAFGSFSVASAAPLNARRAKLLLSAINSVQATTQSLAVASDPNGSGIQQIVGSVSLAGNGSGTNAIVDIATAQTLFFTAANAGGGTPTFSVILSGYEF